MTNSKVYFHLYTPYYNVSISAIYVSIFLLDIYKLSSSFQSLILSSQNIVTTPTQTQFNLQYGLSDIKNMKYLEPNLSLFGQFQTVPRSTLAEP